MPKLTAQDKKDAALLAEACRITGTDPSKIKPGNPFKKSGATAKMIQMGVSQVDPVRAAEWRLDAGFGFSVKTISELQSGEPLSAEAQQDLYDHDPAFVREFQQQKQQSFEDQLKALEDGANQKRLQNTMVRTGGDERQARRVIAAEDAEQAAREQQRQGALN